MRRETKIGLLVGLFFVAAYAIGLGQGTWVSDNPVLGLTLCGRDGVMEIWAAGCAESRDGKVRVPPGAKVVMVFRVKGK